jgi:protein transport protein SEC24
MSAPQDGYPPQGYPQADPYAQQPQQPGFANAASPPPPAGHVDAGGKKKKRGYATQAYDFGAGANSALGNAPPAAGVAPAFGGYPAAAEAPAAYGVPYAANAGVPATAQPSYGQPLSPSGEYQRPDVGYPGPGAPAPGVGGITQNMGQMGLGAQQAAPAQQGQGGAAARQMTLNQLYPTDLLNQPFNVAELELPPPPIILPPNVSWTLIFAAFRNLTSYLSRV